MTDKSPTHTSSRPAVETGFPASLESGYRAFLGGRFGAEQTRFRELAEGGQNPRVMLVGCCDSRVSPEVIFDARPGEIFVVRNVANLVPPYAPNDDYHGTSAALEFGIMGLRVEHIVVMGHAQCGGIKAYVENELDPYARPLSPGDFIGKWIRLIAPAFEAAGQPPADADIGQLGGFLEKLGLESIKQSLANLRTFPCVQTLEQRGLLRLHGAYFGVMDGRLLTYVEAEDRFVPIAAKEHAAALAEPRF
ncbi:carbonic anhydrase [Roseiarcaceae bacterium H3SJ34-1]|uniref:carbonic anhydrase n=1 Tax=Terripilifer ovatus TaxID=3032367 RepID=UPI003AB93B94|nr:carbonic anhydrase [Roseiarcaceae bacterium H3SJ34-1]